jgi:hypothetical protein
MEANIPLKRGRGKLRRYWEHQDFLYWVGLIALLMVSFWLRLNRLASYRWGYDEGIFLMFARFIAAGYQPYSEVFVSYLPPFPYIIALVWKVFGSVTAVRLTIVVFALIELVVLSLIARHLVGRLAGLVSPLLLSFHPEFFQLSRAVMADVPATSLAIVAIGFAWWYSESGHRRWLVVSVLSLVLSLMVKPVVAFAFPLCFLLIAWRHAVLLKGLTPAQRRCAIRRTVEDGLLAVVVFVAPIILILLVFDAKAMSEQAIKYNFAGQVTFVRGVSETSFIADFLNRLRIMGEHLWAEWGLVFLALFGLITIVMRDLRRGWPVLAWFLLTVVSLLFDVRLSGHHWVILLPPLALAAAVGTGYFWRSIWMRGGKGNGRLIWQMGGTFALILFLGYVPAQLTRLRGEEPLVVEGRQEMIEFIRQVTFEDDCVITDDPLVAFQADRLTPPELSETSEDRITSGYLTVEELIAITERHDCPVVVFTKKARFRELLPDYFPWVRTHYLAHRGYPHDELFYIKRSVQTSRSEPIARLGDQILLWDYQFNPKDWKAGRRVPLRLFWETFEPVKDDYKVFVQLRNDQNQVVAQADHLPFNGLLPTSAWPPGDILVENFWLDLPMDLPAGDYMLVTGLYCPDTGERLPVANDISGESAVVLGSVNVESP